MVSFVNYVMAVRWVLQFCQLSQAYIQFEHLAISTYLYTGAQSWYRYVDDTFVVLHSDEKKNKIRKINAVDPNIKYAQVNIYDNRSSFWIVR